MNFISLVLSISSNSFIYSFTKSIALLNIFELSLNRVIYSLKKSSTFSLINPIFLYDATIVLFNNKLTPHNMSLLPFLSIKYF